MTTEARQSRRSSTTRSRTRCTPRPRPTTTRRPACTSPVAGSPASPAEHFCFAQIGKPGSRRKTMTQRARHHPPQRRAAARDARADRAGRQPDRRPLRALRAGRAVGVRRPGRLEVLRALLRPLRALPRRRRTVIERDAPTLATLPQSMARRGPQARDPVGRSADGCRVWDVRVGSYIRGMHGWRRTAALLSALGLTRTLVVLAALCSVVSLTAACGGSTEGVGTAAERVADPLDPTPGTPGRMTDSEEVAFAECVEQVGQQMARPLPLPSPSSNDRKSPTTTGSVCECCSSGPRRDPQGERRSKSCGYTNNGDKTGGSAKVTGGARTACSGYDEGTELWFKCARKLSDAAAPTARSSDDVSNNDAAPEAEGNDAPAAGSTPEAGAEVFVIDGAMTPRSNPATLTNGNSPINELRWVRWGESEATAEGLVTVRDCVPDCATEGDARIPLPGSPSETSRNVRWTSALYKGHHRVGRAGSAGAVYRATGLRGPASPGDA